MTQQKKPNPTEKVSRALRESMVAYETYANKVRYVIDDDMTAISQVELTAHTTTAISRSHGDLYTLKMNRHTRRRFIDVSLAGKALYLTLKSPTSEMLKYFHAHTLNPYVDVYIHAVSQHGVDGMAMYELNTYLDDAAQQWVERMNAFVQTLRVQTRTPDFKKAIRASQRSCNKNYKNFITYLKALFQKNGRILGLRADFSYRKTHNFDQAGSDISYEEAKRHREALVDEIRRRFKGVLLGYVWKFEYGLLKGYHSHFLIFLDGSKVREDVTIVKMLGEHWRSAITEGRGAYHNCNANKSSYRFCGIGDLRHDDPLIWQGLDNIATYLTKPDHYVRLNMPDGDRALGKGGPPKLYAKKKGRPRKSADSSVPPEAQPSITPSVKNGAISARNAG